MKKIHNILIIERKLDPTGGGVQRVSYILGEEFRKKGYNIWYAYYIKETDTDKIPQTNKFLFNMNANENELIAHFSQFIRKNQIDTLFCQNIYTEKFCSLYKILKKEFGVRIIACLHANPDMTVNKDKLGLTFTKIYIKNKLKRIQHFLLGDKFKKELINSYRIADKYVLLSKRFIPIMKNILKMPDAHKLCGINNPCALPMAPYTEKENIILVVSRMEEEQKRISNVLMVWKQIGNRHLDWKLLIVGDGPDLQRYKHIAHKMQLPNITFEGHSDNVFPYYQKSKIFLMTSIWEGFGMTLIEAQNSGCVPVVFDNFSVVHDIIDGNNGTVIRSNDIETYIAEVEKLISQPSVLSTMSKNARTSSHIRFSKERIIKEWLNLFKELEDEK